MKLLSICFFYVLCITSFGQQRVKTETKFINNISLENSLEFQKQNVAHFEGDSIPDFEWVRNYTPNVQLDSTILSRYFVWVSQYNGNDTTGDGSELNPYRTMLPAIENGPNICWQSYYVYLDSGDYHFTEEINNAIEAKIFYSGDFYIASALNYHVFDTVFTFTSIVEGADNHFTFEPNPGTEVNFADSNWLVLRNITYTNIMHGIYEQDTTSLTTFGSLLSVETPVVTCKVNVYFDYYGYRSNKLSSSTTDLIFAGLNVKVGTDTTGLYSTLPLNDRVSFNGCAIDMVGTKGYLNSIRYLDVNRITSISYGLVYSSVNRPYVINLRSCDNIEFSNVVFKGNEQSRTYTGNYLMKTMNSSVTLSDVAAYDFFAVMELYEGSSMYFENGQYYNNIERVCNIRGENCKAMISNTSDRPATTFEIENCLYWIRDDESGDYVMNFNYSNWSLDLDFEHYFYLGNQENKYINTYTGRNVQMPDIYEEHNSQVEYTVTNVSDTFVVGNTNQNHLIDLAFTLSRGDSIEVGNIKIVCKTDTAMIVYDTEWGDDINVNFELYSERLAAKGNYVELIAKLDDDILINAKLAIEAKRIMTNNIPK